MAVVRTFGVRSPSNISPGRNITLHPSAFPGSGTLTVELGSDLVIDSVANRRGSPSHALPYFALAALASRQLNRDAFPCPGKRQRRRKEVGGGDRGPTNPKCEYINNLLITPMTRVVEEYEVTHGFAWIASLCGVAAAEPSKLAISLGKAN